MNRKRNVLPVILLVFLLCTAGCRNDTFNISEPGISTSSEAGPQDGMDERISVYRQWISENFVLSETGIYCLKPGAASSGKMVLYCDKDSNSFIYLCGRPDCMHNDETCDAWLPSTVQKICYYDGKLYYIDHETTRWTEDVSGGVKSERIARKLYCMDLKGTHREELTDLYREEELERYSGAELERYSLGYVKIGFDRGKSEFEFVRRYGSLEHPDYFQDMPGPASNHMADGMMINTVGEEIFLEYSHNAEGETDENGVPLYRTVYKWNPERKTNELLGEVPMNIPCYIDADSGWYVASGILYRWDYQNRTAEETADLHFSEGNNLYIFPDCLMVTDSAVEQAKDQKNTVTMKFYSREYEDLGECEVECEEGIYARFVLFGETESRILLNTAGLMGSLPTHYIEKSDFGTGEIRLHEYHFPEE